MVASSLVVLLSLATVGVGGDAPRVETLNGIVLGPAGQPVPDAELFATSGGCLGLPFSILGRTRSGVDGKFVLRLNQNPTGCDRPTLWAVDDGLAVGSCPIDHRAMQGEPVRMRLNPSGGADFVVAGPDGRPIAGARIIPRTLAREPALVPSEIAELTAMTTDHNGRAELDGFRPEELLSVTIEAAGFGSQVREFRTPEGLADSGTKGITLHPVGRVTGRVVADDPKSVDGLTVRVESASGRGASIAGFAEVVTDRQGHFEVPAIASGTVTIRVHPRDGSAELPGRVPRRSLEAGRVVEVEIPLRRGVRVTGVAVDAVDGRPVPGVMVAIVPSGLAEPTTVVTDENGRYETFVPPGLASHRVLKVPSPYLCLPRFVGPRPVEVPAAIARFELPTIRLQRGGELLGQVVDAQNQPVAGATVEASWTMIDSRIRAPLTEATTTKADGSFVLQPVPTDSEFTIIASIGEARTVRPTTARVDKSKPITLTLNEPEGDPATGLVRSTDGQPIAGASVRIWSMSRTPGGSIESTRLLRFEDDDDLTTDDNGRFQTPGPLRADREYRAFASAEGFDPSQTRAIRPERDDSVAFPDLILPREGRHVAISGRVVDRDGKPLPGVEVWTSIEGPCRQRASTDSEGRFRLPDVAEGRRFLFAEKDGFRFFGRSIEPGPSTIEIALIRHDESATTPMTTRAIPSAGLGLARRVLTPYAEKVLTEGDHSTRLRTLELLARVDPKRVLGLIEAKIVEDAWIADQLRHSASRSPATRAMADRQAIIEAIQDPEWRLMAELDAADALPTTARAAKQEWIEKAERDARRIIEPARRVVALARVADRLLDNEAVEHATRLLIEARPIAESLPSATSGVRARVAFAESLARVDLPGALALTETLVDPGAFDRCRVEIARRLAARQPAEASRVLESLRDPRSLTSAIPDLCHDLAAVDPAQARRWLDRARLDEPCLAPYALGLMALAVADVDKPQATAWLREAFDRLDQVADGSKARDASRDPAAVAAALLPVAERIDPALVPELFWRAVALHTPRAGSEIRSDAVLALLLARYDPSVGRTLLEPLADRAITSSATDLVPLITALAILDPLRAVRLIEELPEPADLTFHRTRNEARLTLAGALLQESPACWQDATIRFLQLPAGISKSGD